MQTLRKKTRTTGLKNSLKSTRSTFDTIKGVVVKYWNKYHNPLHEVLLLLAVLFHLLEWTVKVFEVLLDFGYYIAERV